jgi:hypothetical protein
MQEVRIVSAKVADGESSVGLTDHVPDVRGRARVEDHRDNLTRVPVTMPLAQARRLQGLLANLLTAE